jgi:hypothetical protein
MTAAATKVKRTTLRTMGGSSDWVKTAGKEVAGRDRFLLKIRRLVAVLGVSLYVPDAANNSVARVGSAKPPGKRVK